MMTYIGMGALLVGCFMLVVGWQSGVKGKLMGQGAILIVAGACIGIGGNPARDMPNGSPGMVALGFLGIAAVILMFVLDNKKNAATKKEAAQKQAEVIGATMLDRFFVECVLSEADDFSKPKNKQRAQLLADKYNLKYPNGIEELYKQGLNGHKVVSQRFVLNRLEEKRAEERKEFERLNKYSDLTGKAKRIAMLTDRAAELRKEAKSQDQYAEMLMRSGQQKERDWATWGGIADGIAGFGAGVSTAVDIQMQNIQIRAENEKRRQAALPGYMFMTNSAQGNRRNADEIMKEIESFKLKLVSDEPAAELMKKISFSNTDVLVSETGAAMVCTSATLDPKFKIFDDVPAVVDGTIIAKIYDGDQLCGTAQLVLPMYGLGQDIPLNGICIDCCKPGKNYTAKFTAKNLWAMEK
ncbi:hypothetical protein [Pseudoflavonifractor sp. HCP28S3_F10]|uniref:hypothetical protein n=1 Tax=Pseudoflavonifractor sp. HCP28S3_F10 TaxID=3438947 RepID=UPI003F8CACAE